MSRTDVKVAKAPGKKAPMSGEPAGIGQFEPADTHVGPKPESGEDEYTSLRRCPSLPGAARLGLIVGTSLVLWASIAAAFVFL